MLYCVFQPQSQPRRSQLQPMGLQKRNQCLSIASNSQRIPAWEFTIKKTDHNNREHPQLHPRQVHNYDQESHNQNQGHQNYIPKWGQQSQQGSLLPDGASAQTTKGSHENNQVVHKYNRGVHKCNAGSANATAWVRT